MQVFRPFATFLVVLLAACATPGGEAFVTYQASFEQAREAAGQVAEVYNEYDKQNRRRRTDPVRFDPDLADVYVPGALSPLSAKIAEGFAAATVYNEVLARYLNNNTLSLHDEDLAILTGAVASTTGIIGDAAVGNQIRGVVNASRHLANLSLAADDREEFLRSLAENSAAVDAFLVVVRADTTAMFSDARTATALGGGSPEKLDSFRQMLASWVLLIDQTRADLALLQQAAAAGNRGRGTLSVLAESAARIDRYARDIDAARTQLMGVF